MKRKNLIIIGVIGTILAITLVLILIFALKPGPPPNYSLPSRYEPGCYANLNPTTYGYANEYKFYNPTVYLNVKIKGDMIITDRTTKRWTVPLVATNDMLYHWGGFIKKRIGTGMGASGDMEMRFMCVTLKTNLKTVPKFQDITPISEALFEIKSPFSISCVVKYFPQPRSHVNRHFWIASDSYECEPLSMADEYTIRWKNDLFELDWTPPS